MFFATYEISWHIQIILSMLMYVVLLYEIVSILLSMLTCGISLTCLILCPCWRMEFFYHALFCVHADVWKFLNMPYFVSMLMYGISLHAFFCIHAEVWNFSKHNLLLFMLTHVISYFHADVWNFLLSMLTYGISLLSMLTYGISLLSMLTYGISFLSMLTYGISLLSMLMYGIPTTVGRFDTDFTH